MREIEINDIKGVWRNEENDIRLDFTIRINNVSLFTRINLPNLQTIDHIEGDAKIIYNDKNEEASIYIGEKFEAKIYQLRLSQDELILELSDGKFEFKRIATL